MVAPRLISSADIDTGGGAVKGIAWRPGNDYRSGQVATHEFTSHLCLQDHAATARFDATKWVPLGGAFQTARSYSGYQMTPGGPDPVVAPGPVFERVSAGNAESIGGWSLDPTSTEAMIVLASGLPPEWRGRTAYIDIVYSAPFGATVTDSTFVVWRADLAEMRDDDPSRGVAPNYSTGTTLTTKLRNPTRTQRVRLPTSFVVDPDVTYSIRVNRMGADAGDTFAADVRLLSVTLTVTNSSTSDATVVENCGRSWWTTPAVTRTPDGSLISGGSSQNGLGSIIAGKRKPDGTLTAFTLQNTSLTELDEHNVPAFLVHPTTGIVLVAYARHGADMIVNTRRSTTPYEVDFGAATPITYGATTTYVQLYHVGGDTVWLFTRVADGWSLSISSNWGQTWSAPITVIQFPGSDKGYMIAKLVGGTLRVAMAGHPIDSLLHDVCVGEIDIATKEIRKLDGTVVGDIDTLTGPIDVGTYFDHVYVHSGGGSMRLFDVGDGANWEFSFVTWTTDGNDLGVGNDAVYRFARRVAGSWQISSGIVGAGRIIGYLNTIHYHGGCFIPPQTPGGTFLSIREETVGVDSVWIMEQWTIGAGINSWTSRPIRSTRRKIYRPVVTAAGADGHRGLSWNEAEYYLSFSYYLSRVVGIHSFDL